MNKVYRKSADLYYMPHQGKFLDAILNKGIRHVNLRGGVGCGKTATLAMALYLAQRQWPGKPFLICSNTMTNLVACINGMCEFWDKMKLGVKYELHKGGTDPHLLLSIAKDKKWITVKHPMRSLFEPKGLLSFEVSGLFVDEAASCKEEGFMRASGRVRLDNSPLFQVSAGTPMGNNWFAEYIDRMVADGKILNIDGISTLANPFLPKEFKIDLTKKYEGTPYLEQERDGKVVTLGSTCFPFVNIEDFWPDANHPWEMAVDFGYNRPALIAIQRLPGTGSWCIFHSYTPMEVTITDAAIEFFKQMERLFGMKSNPYHCSYDPAGRNKSDRTSGSAAEDLEAVINNRRQAGKTIFEWSFKKIDRSIEYGIQILDVLLRKGKIFVAEHERYKKPNQHSSVYDCLRMIEYETVGKIINPTAYDKQKGLDHICDALRYFVMFSKFFRDTLDIKGHSVDVDLSVPQGY